MDLTSWLFVPIELPKKRIKWWEEDTCIIEVATMAKGHRITYSACYWSHARGGLLDRLLESPVNYVLDKVIRYNCKFGILDAIKRGSTLTILTQDVQLEGESFGKRFWTAISCRSALQRELSKRLQKD